MIDHVSPGCPGIEEISALLDGALDAATADATRTHVARCAQCGAVLLRFSRLSDELRLLQDVRSDVDIAGLVLPQLPKPAAVSRRKAEAQWRGLWDLAPRALGGAAALGAGAFLGMTLLAGGGAAPRPSAMSVFQGELPGAYCAGLPACSARGR